MLLTRPSEDLQPFLAVSRSSPTYRHLEGRTYPGGNVITGRMTHGNTSSHFPTPSSTTAQLLNASFRKIVCHGPPLLGWGQVLNTDPDYVLDISRPPPRSHSQRATSCRNHGLSRSPTSWCECIHVTPL